MTTTPPDQVDTIVDECVKRCLADGNPLNALLRILDAVTMASRLTDFEFEEVKRRSVRRIVEVGCEADDAR